MAGDGSITRPMLGAMLIMINGHFFKGAIALVKAQGDHFKLFFKFSCRFRSDVFCF